jgi:hypothetical protein
MKHLSRIAGIFIFFFFLPTAFCANQNVIVEIDYGGLRQNRKADIQWKQGITALEALQSVAEIKSQQTAEHVFVISVDNIEGQIGSKIWYYNINGKRAALLANKCILNAGDHMKWEYTKDVCSYSINKEGNK